MKRCLPTGMPSRLDYPDCSAAAVLTGAAHRWPDRTALLDGDLTLTFAEVLDHALRVAEGLRVRGVRAGDAVALHQPNSAWFTVTYYGVLFVGGVAVPVNPALPPAVVRAQCEDAGVVAAVTHPAARGSLEAAAPAGLRLMVVVPATAAAPAPAGARPAGARPAGARPAGAGPAGAGPAGARQARAGSPAARPLRHVPLADLLAAAPAEPAPVRGDDLAHLCFTGGTTGRSKAVRVLHRNVVANVLQMACWAAGALPSRTPGGGLTLVAHAPARTASTVPPGGGTTIAQAPMHHTMGLVGQNFHTVMGTSVVIGGRFDPARFVRTVRAHRVTSVTGAPPLFRALLALPSAEGADLSSVRVVTSGAAPVDPGTLERLSGLFPGACVIQGYGLTESTMGLCAHLMDRDRPGPPDSVGAPLFDTDIEVRDLDTGSPLPPGAIGEVWARGPQITDGYHGAPALTGEQFTGGWLRTGDLGHLDGDGWLHLVGRAKDMLIYKGYNVYPAPLEDLLHQHPAVAHASVVGAVDPEAGEIPVAYVVPRERQRACPGLARDLMRFVALRVAPHQRIRDVRFLDALPVSAAGKVLKTELRRLQGDLVAGPT